MFRLEQNDTSDFVVWENNHYLGSVSLASNGFYEYVDKLGRKTILNDPEYITQILERKRRERRE
jgi:hypothetical protein